MSNILTVTESNLCFSFDTTHWWNVVYDKHECHSKINTGTGAKGVDFLSLYQNEIVILTEIKNYSDVPPRTVTIPSTADPKKSLAVVIPQKVRDTLAGIIAYHRTNNTTADATQWQKLTQNIVSPTKKMIVIVWVETDTPSKKAAMSVIFNAIKTKMNWLKADILMTSTETYQNIGLDGLTVTKTT